MLEWLITRSDAHQSQCKERGGIAQLRQGGTIWQLIAVVLLPPPPPMPFNPIPCWIIQIQIGFCKVGKLNQLSKSLCQHGNAWLEVRRAAPFQHHGTIRSAKWWCQAVPLGFCMHLSPCNPKAQTTQVETKLYTEEGKAPATARSWAITMLLQPWLLLLVAAVLPGHSNSPVLR